MPISTAVTNSDVMCNQTVKFAPLQSVLLQRVPILLQRVTMENVPGTKNLFCVPQMLTRIRLISYGVYQVICLKRTLFPIGHTSHQGRGARSVRRARPGHRNQTLTAFVLLAPLACVMFLLDTFQKKSR